jgi:hypothetical protein
MGQSQYDLGDAATGLGRLVDPAVDAVKTVLNRRSRELEWQRHQQYKDALKEWEYNKHKETTTGTPNTEEQPAPAEETPSPAPLKRKTAEPVSAKSVIKEDRKTKSFPGGVTKNLEADTGPRKGRSTFVPTKNQKENRAAGPRTPSTRSMTTTTKSGVRVTTRVPAENAGKLGKLHTVTEAGHSLGGAKRPATLATPKSPAARKPTTAAKVIK